MGITEHINFHETSDENAACVGYGTSNFPYCVVLNPSSPNFEFFAGHEAAHAKLEHSKKSLLYVTGIAIISCIPKRPLSMCSVLIPSLYALFAYKRQQEAQADALFCKHVDAYAISQAIKFFGELEAKDKVAKKEEFNHTLEIIGDTFNKIISTHPLHVDRRRYLEQAHQIKARELADALVKSTSADLSTTDTSEYLEQVKKTKARMLPSNHRW